MDNEMRPARRLAETCGTMNFSQIADFLEDQGFRSYPKRHALTPKNRQALEDFRDEFLRERHDMTGTQAGDEDRRASETVCDMIRRRLRCWELAASARALLDIYQGLDRQGIESFLCEQGLSGEPETWTWEQADAFHQFGKHWCLLVWTENPPPDLAKEDKGYRAVLRVLDEFNERWDSAQPIHIEVSVLGFREERNGDIITAWDSSQVLHKEHQASEDMLVLDAELPNSERGNEEGVARRIAQDIFHANGDECTVSVSYYQGLGDEYTDYRTHEFGPKNLDDGRSCTRTTGCLASGASRRSGGDRRPNLGRGLAIARQKVLIIASQFTDFHAHLLHNLTRRRRTMAKAAVPTKPLTKTELLANIAAATDLPKNQVVAVLEALGAEIQKSLGSKGAGAITIPGLLKIEKKKVPARKAEKGVPNPFKPGELMDRPAKPAYNKVKVRALKSLKEMAK